MKPIGDFLSALTPKKQLTDAQSLVEEWMRLQGFDYAHWKVNRYLKQKFPYRRMIARANELLKLTSGNMGDAMWALWNRKYWL